MRRLFYLLLGVLATLTLWSDENASTNLNTDEIEEISQKREIVTLVGKEGEKVIGKVLEYNGDRLLYTSPSPRDKRQSRMPSCA